MKIRFGSVGASVVLFRCWKSVCEKNHSKINKSLWSKKVTLLFLFCHQLFSTPV